MGAGAPQIYTIAAHRGFADALVAGLIPRYREEGFGLARLTLLLPSRRAARTVTEAFVRASDGGLLLPRMVVVGDLDLDEALGSLLDPIGEASDTIPPAIDPTRRRLELAALLRDHDPRRNRGEEPPPASARLREADLIGRTIDRLLVEGVSSDALLSDRVLELVPDLADHWKASTLVFATIERLWRERLAQLGRVDPPTRRNLLFDHAAQRWRDDPPASPIVAAGVTSASPALARMLRVVSELPQGAVILPDLALADRLDDDVWDGLGHAGVPEEVDGAPIGRRDALTHPQYHLKLLLNRMGVNRAEIDQWHRAGMTAARPERSKAIANLFLPPGPSARWADLGSEDRRLEGVTLMESANSEEEAQAIAILIREALEAPERRVALVTPDRGLAARVVAHLRRWNIAADDTAGTPLPQTAPGRLFLLAAEILGGEGGPVALTALLQHPLVMRAENRKSWLENARKFDRALRGPRPAPGLAPLRALADEKHIREWWDEAEALIAPLFDPPATLPLDQALRQLSTTIEALGGTTVWGGAEGRALSAFIEDLRTAAETVPTDVEPRELPSILRDAMEDIAVRPPWGGHPRVSIYGLLESRMSRAELVICGAMHEGSWPAAPSPDALLPPPVMRALGVPDGEFRIGLSAHDLAAALGAPDVVLSHARRDESGPVIPSRFVQRVRALMGEDLARRHTDQRTPALARSIDWTGRTDAAPRPAPDPAPERRKVPIAVTALDRLLGDPYQFYASEILRLKSLDGLDDEPSAKWKGTAAHKILQRWHEGEGDLETIAREELAKMSGHPLVRHLWWPRLREALDWVADETGKMRAEGRTPIAIEEKGTAQVCGATLVGRADRIDRLPNGSLAILDYKTGAPPSKAQIQNGFALQLGLIGLMARAGAFKGVAGDPELFEYWSLGRLPKTEQFGHIADPHPTPRGKRGIPREEFLDRTADFLRMAVEKYIDGREPFLARENPDYEAYTDYDHLMRLEEWIASPDDDDAEDAA